MKIGIYGGAFDPPHVGHVLVAQYALATTDLDQIWVVPCWRHAFNKHMAASFDDRVQMCKRAFRPDADTRIRVEPIEKELRTRFTIDLLERLQSLSDKHSISLIIGSDEWRVFNDWHRADDIKKNFPIIVVDRYGSGEGKVQISDVSSTDIRNRLALTKPEYRREITMGLLPTGVIDFIEAKNLYPTQER